MTRREASLILGLRESATEDRIKDAHRRIMIANHPDSGERRGVAAPGGAAHHSPLTTWGAASAMEGRGKQAWQLRGDCAAARARARTRAPIAGAPRHARDNRSPLAAVPGHVGLLLGLLLLVQGAAASSPPRSTRPRTCSWERKRGAATCFSRPRMLPGSNDSCVER